MVPLAPETKREASKLSGVHKMLSALSACTAIGAVAPTAMLNRSRSMQLHALNSFVHGGIHPLQRRRDGYPVMLVRQVPQSV